MRGDEDLAVYLAARWPGLVREAVRLGCPPAEAADATADALSRVRRDWARASQEDDVDALVRAELRAAVARRPQTEPGGREEAAEELTVLAPPSLDELGARDRARRGRTTRRATAALAVLAVVGGGATYLTARGDEPEQQEEETAEVRREPNPVEGVFWWSDGELHLDDVVVEVDGLRDMTRLGSGVVYGDAAGRVVWTGDDGSQRVLGAKDPDVPVAATDETGLAAWYDPETEQVHVVEASTGNVRAETPVDDAPEVVAVDGEVAYLVGTDGARALTGTTQAPVSPSALLDVRSRIRVFQADEGHVQVVQSAFNVVFRLPGSGADLSPDGNTVATHDAAGAVALYDTRSGAQVDGRLGGGSEVLAVSPRERGLVAYVVADGERAQLRTCQLEDLHCQTLDVLQVGPDTVLAR